MPGGQVPTALVALQRWGCARRSRAIGTTQRRRRSAHGAGGGEHRPWRLPHARRRRQPDVGHLVDEVSGERSVLWTRPDELACALTSSICATLSAGRALLLDADEIATAILAATVGARRRSAGDARRRRARARTASCWRSRRRHRLGALSAAPHGRRRLAHRAAPHGARGPALAAATLGAGGVLACAGDRLLYLPPSGSTSAIPPAPATCSTPAACTACLSRLERRGVAALRRRRCGIGLRRVGWPDERAPARSRAESRWARPAGTPVSRNRPLPKSPTADFTDSLIHKEVRSWEPA